MSLIPSVLVGAFLLGGIVDAYYGHGWTALTEGIMCGLVFGAYFRAKAGEKKG